MTGTIPRVALVEYGIGNLGSVLNACRRCCVEPVVTRTPDDLERADPTHIVLPGVGAAGEVLANLRRQQLEPALRHYALERRTPLLGICVGMQMLAETCEENGVHEGLGLIPGRVAHLAPIASGRVLPHVGWNTIAVADADDPILAPVRDEHFYFLHSYGFICDDEFAMCHTEYGGMFVSGVRRGTICGVQFHPEKSAAAGARMLGNFFGV